MPRTKKSSDPKLVGLLDKAERARAGFEKWYLRAKRAFTAAEKCRKHLLYYQKQAERRRNELDAAT